MKLLIATTLVTLVTACGSSDSNPSGSSDASSAGPPDGGSKVRISALGMQLVQYPITNSLRPEGPVAGSITLNGHKGAVVTINGANVPKDGSFFNAALAAVPDAAPGKKLTISATRDGANASVELPCPAEVTLATVPVEGQSVGKGDVVTVTWTGQIKYANDLYAPYVDVLEYDAHLGTHLSLLQMKPIRLQPTDTSITVTLPGNRFEQYDIQLTVPGDYIATSNAEGYCELVRRVRLVNR